MCFPGDKRFFGANVVALKLQLIRSVNGCKEILTKITHVHADTHTPTASHVLFILVKFNLDIFIFYIEHNHVLINYIRDKSLDQLYFHSKLYKVEF